MKHFALVGQVRRGAAGFVSTLQEGQVLDLRREPDNPHDPYAVQVWVVGRHVGYVAANQVRPLADAMDAKQRRLGTDAAHMPAVLHWSSKRYPLVQVMEMD